MGCGLCGGWRQASFKWLASGAWDLFLRRSTARGAGKGEGRCAGEGFAAGRSEPGGWRDGLGRETGRGAPRQKGAPPGLGGWGALLGFPFETGQQTTLGVGAGQQTTLVVTEPVRR
ncbi:hypothetical protein Ssi03_45380 [Sphaerisporangium siamense]|nr:hypothetical protein Ssi03_45380 [Sphaerisporangium siamense]